MQVVIDIPNRIYKIIQNKTLNIMDAEILEKAVKNGTPISDNATNGDVMKIIFPKIGVYDEWYDEPYQREADTESEVQQ